MWVGDADESTAVAGSRSRIIDCDSGTLLPGFHDAHIHLAGYANSLKSVDCRPTAVSSIRDLQRAIRDRAAGTPGGELVRGWGYDETALADRRHPTRDDLDAASTRHPVRLDHRSGHATVLNSVAMERVGIGIASDEPPGATIVRDLQSGIPNGVLFEMDEFLEDRLPGLPTTDMLATISAASDILLSYGITSIQDATHHNSVERWERLTALRGSVEVMPRVTLMPGHTHLSDFVERGLGFGSGDSWFRIGHAKVMATASSGVPWPSTDELVEAVAACAEVGFPVAIHAVESEVVRSAALAISANRQRGPQPAGNRIEHASELPVGVMRAVSESSAVVVTQPAFIHFNGDRYANSVPAAIQPYLYRVASLADRGVHVAFGSDAPVVDPNPLIGISSAMTRRTAAGIVLNERERIALATALDAYTRGPAAVAGIDGWLGTLSPGCLADMVLFGQDLGASDPGALLSMRPVMTILGGEVVWEA